MITKCSKGLAWAAETGVILGMMTLKLSNGSQEAHAMRKEQGWW